MVAWLRGSEVAEGSFNYWLHKNLSALTAGWFTAWVTAPAESAYLRFDWSEQIPLNPPCFAVAHLGPLAPQGRQNAITTPTGGAGGYVEHLTELSVWHHRREPSPRPGVAPSARPDFRLELRQLRDMAVYLLRSGRGFIPLVNITANTTGGFETAGRIHVQELREAPFMSDPNPDLERIRLLIRWSSLESV
jgi:hypothetical protein